MAIVGRTAGFLLVTLVLGGLPCAAQGTGPATMLYALAAEPPALTGSVNDFANVIPPAEEAELDRISRSLMAASGDVIVVATVQTVEPYATVRDYAVEMFENRGRGIGERGKDNGLLILLALKERRVEVEVGYDLEQWITDGFAGETSRDFMVPEFRNGRYGAGLVAGAQRIAARIAEGRNVTLTGVQPVRERPRPRRTGLPIGAIIAFLILLALLGRIGRPPRRGRHRWGRGPRIFWSSGVGPFGGGFGGGWGGGGFGGGGFGGGFGGFGGGRSGGGGGGAGW